MFTIHTTDFCMLYDIIASVKNKRILNRKKHIYEKNLLNDNRAVR